MIKTAHDEPHAPMPTSTIQRVNFRAVPCMGPDDARTLTAEDLVWTHVKVQILDFTAVEVHPSPASGKPLETPVKVSNVGTSMTNASLKLSGTTESLKMEPANRLGARIAEAFFDKGAASFPAEAILSGTYTSPQDGEMRQMQTTILIKDPMNAAAGCCVIA